MKGFLFVDKPKGVTSFDVVRLIRRASGERKIGHAGTLDPLATGLLILALGEATKLLEYLIGCDKEYQVKARFGLISDTYDAEGKIEGDSVKISSAALSKNLASAQIKEKLLALIKENFLGQISQVPPKYSALKIAGKRAADRVRAGESVEMKSRMVKIDEFEIINVNWPEVEFRVKCGSGTYIRSLIHDLGMKLGCGAYVVELRRTKICPGETNCFNVDAPKTLAISEDSALLDKNIEHGLVSIEEVGKMLNHCDLNDFEFKQMQDGKILKINKIEQGEAYVAYYSGDVVGIAEGVAGGIKFKKRIF